MILVTGATGRVGRELVGRLSAAGRPVRVLVRDPRKVAHLPATVERAVGDMDDPATLPAALEGVERLFLLTFSTAQQRNIMDAARGACARHVVKLSTIEAGHEPVFGPGRWHRKREEEIRASGLAWTFLRPTMFMSNALEWWRGQLSRGDVVYFPCGEGRVAPVDPYDVAAVAAAALTEDGHEEKSYALTGPELLTIADMVSTLGVALGRDLRRVDVPESAAAEWMRKGGLPEVVVGQLVETLTAVREGKADYKTDAVERVTGRRPRPFADWCLEHAADFR